MKQNFVKIGNLDAVQVGNMSNHAKECLLYFLGVDVYGDSILLKDMRKIYLEWVNNFLTIARFCEFYDLPEKVAKKIIQFGRDHF